MPTLSARLIKLTLAIFAVWCVGNSSAGQAFACQRIDCTPRAANVRAELAELNAKGIKTYIYWQYSGNNCSPWEDSNDQYSFFQGDPLCDVFKEAAGNGMTIGVNAHHLSTHLGETDQLAYLKGCGVSIIRFWAYPNIGSGAGTVRATVDAITAAGMQAIPVICDYSNTCTSLGITGTTQQDPTAWYQTEYNGTYVSYAREVKTALAGAGASLYGLELLNEPHCGGKEGCVTPYANWARDMVGVLSPFRVGIGQKASENTTRGDSPGVGNPSDFSVSNASVGMASAHYYNASEKALALAAASQASALGKPFYIGERGYTCAGDEGEAPGGSGQRTAPACVPGDKSLVITGTIKASEDFAVSHDSPGTTTLIRRSLIPQSQWADYAFVNNQPVSGAIVAIYPSYRFGGSDKFGNTHEYSPGKLGGNLYAETGANYVRTQSDGTFVITAASTCNEVWDYGGWKQYLVVMCPENNGGGVTTVVKDLYAFALTKSGGTVAFGDINVACDADLTVNGTPAPPQSLEYIVRDPTKFLACSDSGELPGIDQSKTLKADINLQFNSDSEKSGGLDIFGWIAEWVRGKIKAEEAFHGQREGFTGVQGVSCDVNSMLTSPVGFYGGIKTDTAELAKYYMDSHPEDTYNDHEQKLPVPLCEELLRCSQGASFDGHNDNMQSCGGMANNLRAPFDATTTNAAGVVIADELGYAARYRRTAKGVQVCKASAAPDAPRYLLSDIAPPEGICGDTNLNGVVLGGDNEMPCPADSRCGDLDNSGAIVSPETACIGTYANGSSVTYTFDQRYFPYDVLYTGTSEPLGNEFSTRHNNYDDSVAVAYAPGDEMTGKRLIPFGGTEGTRPDNVATAVGPGMRFPAGFQSTKLPPGHYNSYAKVSEIVGSGDAFYNPASLVLATPTDYSLPTYNSLRQSISTLSNDITFDAETTFYKIGILENLCTCSIMEKEAGSPNGTRVEKCINAKKDVKIAQPLRNFNELTDAEIRGGGYGFVYGSVGEIVNTATALQPGYKYMGEERQEGNKAEDEAYYGQRMADPSIGEAFWTFVEDLINCGLRHDDRDVNDVVTGYTAGCGRIIPTIAKLQTTCPWCKNMSRIKNALISTEAFSEPFVQKVNVVSTCEVDTAATKSQTPTDKQGTGLEMVFNESASRSVTQATNSVSSPSFGVESAAASGPPSPPGPPGPGGTCAAGCSVCYDLSVEVNCSKGCVTNSSPDTWGDVHIGYKNLATGITISEAGPSNILTGGELCAGAPGAGTFKFEVTSNNAGCQTGGGSGTNITCP
jgi:hypothetical protein